ncbi:hypothetical protein ON010_g17399 [Phytophthora cinnamomi]|nr:hypothetical protein ON010_g17399 [Phytophthora cinnamomi]
MLRTKTPPDNHDTKLARNEHADGILDLLGHQNSVLQQRFGADPFHLRVLVGNWVLTERKRQVALGNEVEPAVHGLVLLIDKRHKRP